VRTPAKLAGDASPIEAWRYSPYGFAKSAASKKAKPKRSTPLRIAALNIARSPKKTFLTILSLGLCGVLLVCAASLQENITASKEVRYEQFQYGDFKLEVIGGESGTYSEIQQLRNPLSDDLKRQIASMDGVLEIHEWKSASGSMRVNDAVIDNRMSLYGYSMQDKDKLASLLSEGTADYDALSQNNGLIICSSDSVRQLYGWDPRLNDKATFATLNGKGEYVETTLNAMCITSRKANFQG
jgi:putative ABC transport system permease protein